MTKIIKPWLENINIFEGHPNAKQNEGKQLSLEKIALMINSIEKGHKFPPVNLIYYKTQREIKKGKFKKKTINKHNYDIAFSSLGNTQFDGGHYRVISHFLAKSELNINPIEDDNWTNLFYSRIPKKYKASLDEIQIVSKTKSIKNLENLPKELRDSIKTPSENEIKYFLENNKYKQIRYKEIINNLYK